METFRRTSLTVSRGTPRHDFSFVRLRLMEITNSRLIPSDISCLMKRNKCANSNFGLVLYLITSGASFGFLIWGRFWSRNGSTTRNSWNAKTMKRSETRGSVFPLKSRSFYGRSKRNLCVAVTIKIYDRICIYVMTRSPSPVGLVRAAMAADSSADVAAAAGRLVVEAAAAQQVRCSPLRPVVAKQLALSLKSDNDKSWLVLRFPSKSSDLITNATQQQQKKTLLMTSNTASSARAHFARKGRWGDAVCGAQHFLSSQFQFDPGQKSSG